jgi:hypothetical protein
MAIDPVYYALGCNALAWAFSAGGVIAELRSIKGRLDGGSRRMDKIEKDATEALQRIAAQEARCEERSKGTKE